MSQGFVLHGRAWASGALVLALTLTALPAPTPAVQEVERRIALLEKRYSIAVVSDAVGLPLTRP